MSIILPFIISLSGSVIIILSAHLIISSRARIQESARRKRLINSYVIPLTYKKRRQASSLSNLNEAAFYYGEKLVKDEYGGFLKNLLRQTGADDASTFSKLVRQKIVLSIVSASFGLFVLLSRNFTSLPIVFFILMFAYFEPNLQDYLLRKSKSLYGRGLNRLVARAGGQVQEIKSLYRKKLVFTVISIFVSYFYLLIKGNSFSYIWLLLISVPFGFFLPDILLVNRVEKRKTLISEQLPEAIDLLSMCVSSGLAFPNALSKVSEMQRGPVSEEFARVNTQVQIGQSRSDALIEMAERTGSKPMFRFVNSVVQVDRFGIPISGALREQAIEIRAERRSLAREKGQKVPIKILGPIMLCFLPCVVIIVLAPAMIGIISGFAGV